MVDDHARARLAGLADPRQSGERSGGNPFFVRELTRLVLAHGARPTSPVAAGRASSETAAAAAGPAVRPTACDCWTGPPWPGATSRSACWCAAGAARHDARRRWTCWTRPAGPAWSRDAEDPRFTHDLYREAILGRPQPGAAERGDQPRCRPRAAGRGRGRRRGADRGASAGGRAGGAGRRHRLLAPRRPGGDRAARPRGRLRATTSAPWRCSTTATRGRVETAARAGRRA